MELTEFQQLIGVKFNTIALLRQALTHRSYVNERPNERIQDNERLEFLGDAVLDFIAADMLYSRFPELDEGKLTRLRSALVRTEALAHFALECRIGEVIIMGKGEEASGGRERINNLCRAFEAVVGAIYLDQGLEAVSDFITPRLTAFQPQVMDEAIRKDSRSQLQEWSQANHGVTPIYRTASSSGPDHKKEFTVEILIGDKVIATGSGFSKQSAAQSAARAALDLVETGQFDL